MWNTLSGDASLSSPPSGNTGQRTVLNRTCWIKDLIKKKQLKIELMHLSSSRSTEQGTEQHKIFSLPITGNS